MTLSERYSPFVARKTVSKHPNDVIDAPNSSEEKKYIKMASSMSSMKILVLFLLCGQNTMYTVLRRYSQGVLKENYSKYEVLLASEVIKMIYSAYQCGATLEVGEKHLPKLRYLLKKSAKMGVLALIYGGMNILSFIALRNISAGMFTVFAQLKILTTATCSRIMLDQQYSMTKWRALFSLMMGVLLFSETTWNGKFQSVNPDGGNIFLGTAAVLIEVTLSGFASIYFEKVIKLDTEQLGIWERNYQLAFCSIPIYILFLLHSEGGDVGYGGGWSINTVLLALLGAAGGLLVALSIKYGDSILKTLATTGAIILSAILDRFFLGGELTPIMCIAGVQVIIAICNYTFDTTQAPPTKTKTITKDEEMAVLINSSPEGK